ncbi:sulfite exporter TauE/SafE family protein [Microbulbifer halophilus]|uniref:Probable membrane transporter protein n=1 Tax=Microbulbifer halophilus TaxID=453963 RepID=A0ABW5EDL8_9GAMM|nr:sulfite exporter TauE/SafE family protein [Microbulbifer halophilus]MCW8126346.1 sulfite exporter TauE/SafE family protein [Microbulbifer halophilus]
MYRQSAKGIYLWLGWLAAFYAVWAFLVFGLGNWQMVEENWSMALAMALGSYAAGSTPMGGGTVGFPVLVLLFDTPASLGRDFSFAVQAIGMVSASFFLLARRRPLAGAMLKGAMLGSLLGTPLGIQFVAPLVPELWIKLAFAVIWGSFGLLHLYRLREITGHTGSGDLRPGRDFRIGLALGVLAGGSTVAVTGVGIDMVVYAALVLLCRVDLKVAIPTSVVIMAFNSVLGVAVKSISGDWHPEVFGNWLAAAPVVILGAPFGVFIVALVDRRLTLLVVALLCVGQLVWTCFAERSALGVPGLLAAAAAVGLCLLAFEYLRRLGRRRVSSAVQPLPAGPQSSAGAKSDSLPLAG